ncbi:hypothetical protein, partial [Bacteroides togonis]|uniref:hypothetical protein n=1 Tax=Bacteroides togonis TaxID=1917883 RepID=UPI001F221E61
HLSYWEQNIEIIFRISLLEKVNNALIVDKEKRVNRVLRHTLLEKKAKKNIVKNLHVSKMCSTFTPAIER